MRQLTKMICAVLLISVAGSVHAQTIPVESFHKVTVSPYIQASFVEGDVESVTINSAIVDKDKLHIEVHGGNLRLYLDGAKDFPKNVRNNDEYTNHAVVVTVTYRDLDALSLRGAETYFCASPLWAENFSLHVYGESKVIFNNVHISQLHGSIYGESSLEIRAGEIHEQYYTCFGEGKINATAISGEMARVTAFGEAEFRMNVSDEIKITAFGDARLCYLGHPTIVRGIHFGDVDLQRID